GALARLPLPSAGTDEPVGLVLRTDAQPSPVARTLIDAVRDIARSRFGDARLHRAPRAAHKPARGNR
ncbi:MAG: pca operon transcription factor PcaQ, partial [Burkholderia sp.]|nr:pca operon transcription factor PcaQ [Burkholderia sp.]